jgi:MYXO-CTERM domain-containing protein
VVHERLGDPGDVPRLDHVWLSLGKRVKSPFEPALVHVRPPALAPGDAVSVASTVGGVPQKLDQGGSVRDARTDVLDYFVADTDTSEGSSGGGAFDRTGALLGVLVRGAADYALTQDGCFVTVTQDDPAAAEEQFGYASRAVEELCADEPETSSLCRDDCEVPCRAAPRPPDASTDERQAGCSLGAPEKPAARGAGAFTLFLLAALSARRRRTALSRSASTTAMLDAALRCLEKASRARG